jgi:hypothetical protein
MRISKLSVSPSLLVRYLLIFTAIILFILSAATFLRTSPDPDMKVIYVVYGILMLGDGVAMLIGGLWITKRLVYSFVVIVLSLNIILTIFDQFGLIDFLFALLNVITLFFMLRYRKELLSQ